MRWEKHDEVFVRIFCLQKVLGASFVIVGIAYRQHRIGSHFTVRVRVHQSLESQPGLDVLAFLEVFRTGFKKGFIRGHDAFLKLRGLFDASPGVNQDSA